MKNRKTSLNRSGFTLMELLLVIALLAVVAAVAAPQFFRSTVDLADDARLSGLKSNYALILQAFKSRLEHERANPDVLPAQRLSSLSDADYADTGSKIRLLVDNGFLPRTASLWEARLGKPADLLLIGVTTPNKLPPFLKPFSAFQVVAQKPDSAAQINVTSELETKLASGKSVAEAWSEIWSALNS